MKLLKRISAYRRLCEIRDETAPELHLKATHYNEFAGLMRECAALAEEVGNSRLAHCFQQKENRFSAAWADVVETLRLMDESIEEAREAIPRPLRWIL